MEGHYLVGNQGIYKILEFLGEGSFGKVAKCSKLGSPECYAIKIMNCSREGQKEFKMMKLIKDLDPDENHLIKMFERFTFQGMTCIVFELLDVSLIDSYKRDSSTRTHLCLIRVIAQQMLKALKALKGIGVTHCDIKLDNIMFAERDSAHVKLIDFGLAVETKKLSTGTEIQITPFRAPEVILGLPLDESVDMWALGVVLAGVYFGNYPFPCDTEYETIRAMVQIFGLPEAEVLHKAKYKAPFFTRDNDHVINLDAVIHEHQAFIDLLKSMLEVNPQNRITPSQALQHDFITMKHLARKRKAKYASKAKELMGQIQLEEKKKKDIKMSLLPQHIMQIKKIIYNLYEIFILWRHKCGLLGPALKRSISEEPAGACIWRSGPPPQGAL
uniref:Protein kinase domain-containing protein n=1 Tax=Oryzias sinensis TaxID=183150 RepID=A0A8C7X996_9TELE